MRRSLLVAGLFVITALAGCLSGDTPEAQSTDDPGLTVVRGQALVEAEDDGRLSQPVYDEMIVEQVLVPSSLDGKLMDNWVYRPVTDGEAVPVFINFSPYWGNLAGEASARGDAFSMMMIDYFVPRGYAVVLSSVRGTGMSEGCFDIGGSVEQQDAYDVVEHFGAAEWSNGAVGAGGKSYDGTTPNGVLVTSPPSLKTIFPVSGISELYKYNYKGGLPYATGIVFNTYYYVLVGVANTDQQEVAKSAVVLADDIACLRNPEIQANGVGSGVTGDYTDYWVERDYAAQAGGINTNVSVFFVHGLQDWNVKPDHILPFITEVADAGVPVKAWLHQGGHVYPERLDWNLTMLKWLDYWLKDIETGIMDEPLVQVKDNLGRWRHEDSWPPADAVQTSFYLGDGGLVLQPPAAGKGEFGDSLASDAGQASYLEFVSAPVEQDFHYAGEPVLRLTVTSDQPRGHVVADLYDIDENGNWNRINWGGLNLRHREDLRDPQLVDAGATYEIEFRMHPQDDVILAGHSIGLRLGPEGGMFTTVPSGATITVDLGESSVLTLPRISNDLLLEAPQPIEVACWTC